MSSRPMSSGPSCGRRRPPASRACGDSAPMSRRIVAAGLLRQHRASSARSSDTMCAGAPSRLRAQQARRRAGRRARGATSGYCARDLAEQRARAPRGARGCRRSRTARAPRGRPSRSRQASCASRRPPRHAHARVRRREQRLDAGRRGSSSRCAWRSIDLAGELAERGERVAGSGRAARRRRARAAAPRARAGGRRRRRRRARRSRRCRRGRAGSRSRARRRCARRRRRRARGRGAARCRRRGRPRSCR